MPKTAHWFKTKDLSTPKRGFIEYCKKIFRVITDADAVSDHTRLLLDVYDHRIHGDPALTKEMYLDQLKALHKVYTIMSLNEFYRFVDKFLSTAIDLFREAPEANLNLIYDMIIEVDAIYPYLYIEEEGIVCNKHIFRRKDGEVAYSYDDDSPLYKRSILAKDMEK